MENECEWLLSYDRHRERKMTDLLYGILYSERYLKKKLKIKIRCDYYLKVVAFPASEIMSLRSHQYITCL